MLAHADRCLNGSRFVVARLTGGKDHRIGEIAGSIETGGRSLPRKAARHIALVRGIGRHVDGDTAQFAAQVGGVCRRTAEDRGRADDGNGVAVFPAGRTDKGVQIRVGTAGQFAAGNTHQPDIRGAGGDTGLLENSAGNAYVHAIDPVAGSNIGDVEAALSAAVHVQLASHVFDGVRHHIEFELQADLGIHGDHDFGGAVVGGIVGRKHDLVHFQTVVGAQGYSAGFIPGKAAADGFAAGGRRAVQLHIGKARAVGDELAAQRVDGRYADGNGVLHDLKVNVLAFGGFHAVVVGEGDGDLQRVEVACAVLIRVVELLHRYGDLAAIVSALFVLGNQILGKGLDVLDAGEITQVHGGGIRDGVQSPCDNAPDGIGGKPGGGVLALAHGTRGDRHRHGLSVKPRARPAGEFIAVRRGVEEHDLLAFDGVFFRVGPGGFTADEIVADVVDNRLPLGLQGDFAHRAGGDVDAAIGVAVQRINARDIKAAEVIARAGGGEKGQSIALDVVGGGVAGGIFAAAQLVGDGVIHRLPERVQRHGALDNIRIERNAVDFTAVRRTEPAEEFVVLPLGILGNFFKRQANMFQGHGVGLFLLAVVQLVGQNGDLLPAGVEGHTPCQLVFRRLHRLRIREVGCEIPAQEIVAVVVGQNDFQRGVAQLPGGVGEFGEIALIAGEHKFGIDNLYLLAVDLLIPAAGNIARRALRAAEVHGDIHPPVGIQGDIAGHLPGEVEGGALAGGIVVPARKGQSLDIGIGGPGDGFILLHSDVAVGAKVAVVIQEVRLIVVHALQGDRYIVGRHGEGDGVAIGGVLQPLRLGGEAQTIIAGQQLGGEGDLFAGRHGGQIGKFVAHDLPGVNALPVVHGDRAGNGAQGQNDHGFVLPSGDGQPADNGSAAVQAHHDRPLAAVEGGAVRGQRPAAFLALHGREGHGFRRVAAADSEHHAIRHFGGFDDVGDLAAVAGITACEQIEGQVVFSGGCKDVIAHSIAFGRQIAHIADARYAVLHGAVDLIQRGIEPRQRRSVDFRILLLHRGEHGIQVNHAGRGGFHGAAQNMGVFKGGLKHGGVVPVGSFDAPGMGAPVIQGDIHIDNGGGHLELPGQRERHPIVLDQLGLILVLVGQHHVAFIVCDLVGGSRHFIRIDHTELAVFAIADVEHTCARVVGRNGFTVDDDVLQRQLRGDIALLQVFKQQLVFGALGGEHIICLHGDIWYGEARLDIGIGCSQCPHIIQLTGLNHAHGHSHGLGVQRPAMAPERPVLLIGNYEDLDLETQLDFNIYTDFQI